jgi:hypothetical protein
MRLLIRTFAVVLLAGQLAQWPVAAWCAGQHRQPASHCSQPTSPQGAALAAADAGSPLGCALADPCAPQAPAVTAAAVTGPFVAAVWRSPNVSRTEAPRSFNPIPIPPPPQS